ncbi:MAG: hypothetical protein WA775_12955 [Psychroserpens sp.]|uniref:hypothetical protein n=1 Tax=Psychroserpens sp. TaxID=2020870 RepID=UPI003CB95CC3
MTIKNVFSSLCITLSIGLLVSCNTATKNNTEASTQTETANTNNAQPLTSKMTKADKKKFYNASNEVVYEVKYKQDGFKLRTATSNLLWKIKLYDDKVKISDNEENLDPYEIKMVGIYEAKLVRADKTIARTSYDPELNQQFVAAESDAQPDAYQVAYSPSLLITRITEIAKDQQDVLMKELKDKGY